ncbi:NtaA/DmoA family FMN-dependent monooxygenase [Ottowia thiooxydans]|uniref:NtaA/DmoA family FMN-dependent monooxygenase n=1 Tax=Ottowia thiooxydans TaxID=219182 RepID=UPI0004109706|nr:NtaA/DmoA family FMN-dependent monooxygenase [Ottowia thiooxydans]
MKPFGWKIILIGIELNKQTRQLHLGFTIWPFGFHPAGWRLPGARTGADIDSNLFKRSAQIAESGKFDFFFIGDRVSSSTELQNERPNQVLRPEALSLAGFVAGVTEKIGIVVTVNVTYSEPYSVARATATLDHLSNGRIGLNIVTGEDKSAAQNYGRKEHWDNSLRYEWASEFIEVVKSLWDSWEDDAILGDKKKSFLNTTKIHKISHRGKFFSVEGPLNVERPIQGQLPIVNAGRSDNSIELGARFSDIKFTDSSSLGFEGAKEYYARLKSRAAAAGRNPDAQVVIPGIAVYTAKTSKEAHALYRQVQESWPIPIDLQALSQGLGVVLDGFEASTRISQVPAFLAATANAVEHLRTARWLYGEEDISLADLFRYYRRHELFKEVVGSPTEVADFIQHWFEERAADGFMIFPPYMDGALEDFVELVIPELQARGLFRTEYAGSTLREHFNLARPANVNAAAHG